MALNAGIPAEADLIPGAFPSEDAIVGAERDPQTSQNPTLTGTKTTAYAGNMDEKKKEFRGQQEDAHTAGGLQNDRSASGFEQNRNPSEAISGQDNISSRETTRGGMGNSITGSQGAATSGADQPHSSEKDGGHDKSLIGFDLATVASAVGNAAKDALSAATDSVAPAASAATEQAKNLAGLAQENTAPAANYAAERAGNAAAYTKDTVTSGTSISSTDPVPTDNAMQTAGSAAAYAKDTAYSAANAAQSYAPSVLGGSSHEDSTVRDVAPEVPHTVKESASQARESPEAATNSQAVKEKSKVENELLGKSHNQSLEKPHIDLTSRVKGLEEQLAPDSMTPGVVTVLGTEKDRSFPLAEHPDATSPTLA